jgi:NAD(P)-dependent dehydrogenase (short-subunit alcohol dehydrogenase family)
VRRPASGARVRWRARERRGAGDRAQRLSCGRSGGRHPLRRVGEAEDVATATLFLLSHAAACITGANLDVNGGLFMV